MPKYCCFNCPKWDYSDHALSDKCPTCNYSYDFPLVQPPARVQQYRITQVLSRGFYAAAYVAESGGLNDRCVLKIASKEVYKFFDKNFEEECRIHARVAEDSPHVVPIRDMLDIDVSFGDLIIPCHVAVLDYVRGTSLKGYLEGEGKLQARTIAQIGIDLFRILDALETKGIYHNDLHSENIIIKELSRNARRAEAVDDSIRAIAVDLGSVSDNSKSDEEGLRLGDLHWVASHLRSLVEHLLQDPHNASDAEYRLASLLEERAQMLSPTVTSQRRPSIEECINDIKDAYQQVSSPWKEPLKLRTFKDGYNAQTLDPWFVPHLLVDPDGQWEQRMSTRGPQVITGMRGCGKTMLLRSLQFHARVTAQQGESSAQVLDRIKKDGFIGLYVSCTKLLDRLGNPTDELHEPFARLLVAYGLEAIRAIRHLQEISSDAISPFYYRELAAALAHYLRSPFSLAVSGSEFELERQLIETLVSLSRGDSNYSLVGHPSIVFPHLAEAISKCSPRWANHDILFLLDDVSTRYLNEPKIRELLSSLLFQSSNCAFKLTTEAQTLELVLRSPGQVEKARVGRDYDVFDLGAEVYEKVRKRKGAGDFVERILARRAAYYSNHPPANPRVVIGDTSLKSIAERIVSTSDNSNAKKQVYYGITALAGVCVGDIGDVIYLYELILRRAAESKLPIPAAIQSECFQDFSSRKLYDLNRRDGELKDFAMSFAEAAYELLIRSNASMKRGKVYRLRQYAKVYVRITTGDFEQQFNRIRELIDAGVFILAGGSDTPRTKTRDSDPIQQFALTYRKLFGLSHYIGLAERDRFELSGGQVEEWLSNPAAGKQILIRNLSAYDEPDESEEDDFESPEASEGEGVSADKATERSPALYQQRLFPSVPLPHDIGVREVEDVIGVGGSVGIQEKTPRTRIVDSVELSGVKIDEIVVGLGFEERTLQSVKRLLRRVKPNAATLIKYREAGKGAEIEKYVRKYIKDIQVIEYEDIVKSGLSVSKGNIFVDISGLAKPALFHAVRNSLIQAQRVWLCDTRAKMYYPLDEDIQDALKSQDDSDPYSFLEGLRKILTGEKGPYKINSLLFSDADESRRRVLCAFSSAKHERLFSLLDERDYDLIEIIAPKKLTPRNKLALIAAEVAADNFAIANLTRIDSHNLTRVLNHIVERYQYWYVKGGCNFEIALTGSKLQAVACAAISAAMKISQCWYVSPQEFDVQRFTSGAGKTTYYEIELS